MTEVIALNGSQLSLWWAVPFVLVLLSIALAPSLCRVIWHRHFGKITAFWTALLLLPLFAVFGRHAGLAVVAHAVIAEYVPFILLLLALYTISGGIAVSGMERATARSNTAILAMGTALAAVMGTTGAAMLLIRPLLKANAARQHRVHVVVFFIILVGNIGGGLTPLGDPPLFVGFLNGISFVWTIQHMLWPVLLSSVVLLSVFYWIDRYYWRGADGQPCTDIGPVRIHIRGKVNFWLLLGVVAAILMSGMWHSTRSVTLLGNHIALPALLRDLILLALALLSWFITPAAVRRANAFQWAPIAEVGKLFLGIFITISPVIAMLKAGESGHFAPLIQVLHETGGQPVNALYFWMSGLLSAFLDNAPTYLVFFNLAGGDAASLMHILPTTLLAISTGSVFMGALSYIGNAPNFMVKSLAEADGIVMPGFFGYMRWSCGLLLPLFALHTVLFFI